jgi:pantothenate kinase
VHAPGFDRRVEEPVPGALALTPEVRCIVVEGNYLLLDSCGWQRVAPLLDLTVGVVLDETTRLERLIARHVAFGKTPEAARAWALGPDQANAELIAPTLARADVLVRAQ